MDHERADGSGLRVLTIGPTHQRGTTETNLFAGNSAMMLEQDRELTAKGCRLEAVDTSGSVTNLHPAILTLLGGLRGIRVLCATAFKLRRCDVVCSIQTPRRMFDFVPLLWMLCRAFRKPLALRVSGGSFATVYAESGRLRRRLADRTSMRADIVFIETRAALDGLPRRDNLRFFPNTRQLPSGARRDRSEVRKLLFLSKIKPDKGLHECLQASQALPEDCELSIYGPAAKGYDLSEVRGYPRARYRGVAEPSEVPAILAEHDLLLLPTYHANEGLPGVILEAFQAGMPVVSTRVGGIPELVEHEVTGLLVEPRSAPQLEEAVKRLLADPGLYRRLCEGARRRGDDYRSDSWYHAFMHDLDEIVHPGRSSTQATTT